ncbi:hypothetical protein NC651_013685 [Populus alba x Populus x berolinensis]|nr:hypothetical protein NC651_013685 [Populus alba x Populus x berolinensis]
MPSSRSCSFSILRSFLWHNLHLILQCLHHQHPMASIPRSARKPIWGW